MPKKPTISSEYERLLERKKTKKRAPNSCKERRPERYTKQCAREVLAKKGAEKRQNYNVKESLL